MAGIYVEGESIVFAEGAEITGNNGGGIIVKDGSYANLDRANISGNLGHGVVVKNSEISVIGATINSNGIDAIYSELGLDSSLINRSDLELIITNVIQKKSEGVRDEDIISEFLGHMSVFSGIASVEPIMVAISAVLACGLVTLKRYKSFFKP